MPIHIQKTLDVVCRHVTTAEEKVRHSVRDAFPAADEEQITTLFQEKLHEDLSVASQQGEIAHAFATDLQNAGVPRFNDEAFQMARGIIAEVSWHPRHVERKSGGDFGLLFVRPKIENLFGEVTIKDGEVTALLAQAKRKLYGEDCGCLTNNQMRILADRLDYTSLVLYKFKDIQNRDLDLFRWQHCRGATIPKVNEWLARASFAPRLTTAEVLKKLESEEIGTTNLNTIESVISPADTRTMRIEIKWKKGEGPSTHTHVLVKPREEVRVQAGL